MIQLRRRHEIRTGNYTALGVQRVRWGMWSWRVWRVTDGLLVMNGMCRTKRRALACAECWRRMDARRNRRDPSTD